MLEYVLYSQSNHEHYSSPSVTPGQQYGPESEIIPNGWTSRTRGLWRSWICPDSLRSTQGWKVHVSSQLERAESILNVVAKICFDAKVPFKHLTSEWNFIFMHHKHGERQQSGKFCALYPATEKIAAEVMELLASEMSDEIGPYILTDRRYRDSKVVHYRYGAFENLGGVGLDGLPRMLVKDGFGREVRDVRGNSFYLPPGIEDPFIDSTEKRERSNKSIILHGIEFARALHISNAGGAYEGRNTTTGEKVFIKEARGFHGLHWDRTDAQERLRREWKTLQALHKNDPAICPEPYDYFSEWEHEFLVTEFVPGEQLGQWIKENNPLLASNASQTSVVEYYAKCVKVLDSLRSALTRLHSLGYRFGDVSPNNVLIDTSLRARLIDFETCNKTSLPLIPMGTQGFVPSQNVQPAGENFRDEYGFSAIALALLSPIHDHVERNPSALSWLKEELDNFTPVPSQLWESATRFYCGDPSGATRSPASRTGESGRSYAEIFQSLLSETQRGILAAADEGNSESIFPTVPDGIKSNTVNLAFGTAGVLHALHMSRAPIPEWVANKFRSEALMEASSLPPGLYFGSAGIACVLADIGFVDEAEYLVENFPANIPADYSFAQGAAGIGKAYLHLYKVTSNERHLDSASRVAQAIVSKFEPAEDAIGLRNDPGLFYGYAGISLFLHALAKVKSDDEIGKISGAILKREDLVSIFQDASLARGFSGLRLVLQARGERIDELTRSIQGMGEDASGLRFSSPGLFEGLAGSILSISNGSDEDAVRANALASGLMKFAIPGPVGVRFLGAGSLRYSYELSSGGAGVLLALSKLCDRSSGHMYLD